MVPITTAITILKIISAIFVTVLLGFGIVISLIVAYDSIKERDWFNCITSIITIIVFLSMAVIMILGLVVGGII